MTHIKAAADPSREALALADRQASARKRYHESDADLIRESEIIEWALRRAAAPAGNDWTVLKYVKRWRTIVKLPAKYADEIVVALAQPREALADEIKRADAAPPEASFDNASDMLGYLNAPREAEPVAPYPQSDLDNLGRRVNPAPMPEALKDTIAACYGLLWEVETDNKRIHRARRGLLQWLTKNEQARGIEAARAIASMNGLPAASRSPIPEAPGGRDEIIERCAKVADNLAAYEGTVFDRADDDGALSETGRHRVQDRAIARQAAADAIARSIRALKPQDGGNVVANEDISTNPLPRLHAFKPRNGGESGR